MELTNSQIDEIKSQVDKLLKSKDINGAIKLLNNVLEKNANNASINNLLGIVLTRTQAQDEALACINKAIKLDDKVAAYWASLGAFHLRRNEWVPALKAFLTSNRLEPNSIEIKLNIVRSYRSIGDNESALKMSQHLISKNPNNVNIVSTHASLLEAMEQPNKALEILSSLISSSNKSLNVNVIGQWFRLMVRFDRNAEARKWLEFQLTKNANSILLKSIYASSCSNDLDYESACIALQEAHVLNPENVSVNYDLAVIYRFMGNREKSVEHFELVLKKDPLNTRALRVLGSDHKYEVNDDYINRLQVVAAHLGTQSVANRVQLHYALGKAHDDLNQLAPAFEHFKLGGRLHLKDKKIDTKVSKVLKEKIQSNLDRAYFDNHQNMGCESDKPVFIVGSPRSGTTLIEQVISSLPCVYGAGELRYMTNVLNKMTVNNKFKIEFTEKKAVFKNADIVENFERGAKYVELIEKLAPKTSKRIVDKMPGNYAWLGLIQLILPNSSLIHSRRHPIETCLSAYRIYFPDGQFWSFDLKDMGVFYREYVEIMEFWENELPDGKILHVRYEDMVADIEGQSKRLASHIGVGWNESCLNFHNSDRPVRTASVGQVRQPIYTTSTNRWHKYKPYLKPLLDEIGDIVDAYEAELSTKTN